MADPRSDKAFPVSWDQFHRDSRALAWRLAGAGEQGRSGRRSSVSPAAGSCRRRSSPANSASASSRRSASPPTTTTRSRAAFEVLKRVSQEIVDLAGGSGAGVLVIDDLVDTGKTARLVREMVPKCHYATLYAKPAGRPLVDTFITEVSQDTWIYFPWDMGYSFQPPIAQDA